MTRGRLKRAILKTGRALILMNGWTKESAPLDGTWDLWCQGFMRDWLLDRGVEPTCWVDLHRMTTVMQPKAWNHSYQAELATTKRPVLLRRKHPAFPTSIGYPFAGIANWYPRSYAVPLSGTMDYLILLAGWLGAKEIGLYGCDYDTAQERMYQTFGAAHAIGYVAGRGTKITIPEGGSLLWNIVPGDYGDQFPPWPYEDDPRNERWKDVGSDRIRRLLRRENRNEH